MRAFVRAAFAATWLLLGLCAAGAARAEDAQLVVTITNGDQDTSGKARFELHPAGKHDSSVAAWAPGGEPATVPAGTYDVEAIFEDGAAQKHVWLNGVAVSGNVAKSVDMGLPVASATYRITNQGEDVEGRGRFEVHAAGKHDGPVLTWAGSGNGVRLPAGSYDVELIFEDGEAKKHVWLDGQKLSGTVEQTVEMGVNVAAATYHITNAGEDVGGNGRFEVHAAGKHDGPVLTWAGSGNEVRLPAGAYDVEIIFEDGEAKRHLWLDGQKLAGRVDQTVDVGVKVAAATYHITNAGEDVGGNGRFEVHAAGKHDGPVLTWAGSGNEVRLPEGTYDVEIIFEDGEAKRHLWLDGQKLAGKVEQTVDVGVNVASALYRITNQGEDVEGRGRFEIHAAGKHDGPVLTWAGSGNAVRLPEGTYDVEIIFEDGEARKHIWLDGQKLAGKVEQTIEVGVKVAAVTYRITNQGEDVESRGRFEIHAPGKHDGPVLAWAGSGNEVRLPEGDYDVAAIFQTGMVDKTKWVDRQHFAGHVDQTVEMGVAFAEPTVTATLNGADVGDKARIGFVPAGRSDEIGNIAGGETAQLEAGTYDLLATMPGAEGALRKVAIAGKPHLVVALQALKTSELKPGGPPPKECTIEVYGVNFDFDKAVLRPDSEPVLQAVLKLFTGAPSFAAEVGGHTDNVGKPDYNLKLSEARAAAVKAWLIAHGVAAARVTSRGYGDTHPLVENDTDENRAKNRRVELRRQNCH